MDVSAYWNTVNGIVFWGFWRLNKYLENAIEGYHALMSS